ncbi:MAG: crossover junction endodeoxyribonuclease RuvC [Planctomycetota bacterium]|jgi:crossover junction endodeoxyribonuclease RuvC
MRFLGIDPGSRRMGWGVVEEQGSTLTVLEMGAVRPRAADPLAQRLAMIHSEVTGILESYAPDCVAIEMVFHGVNTRSLVTLGQARGAILAAVGTRESHLVELSPSEVKKAVTGRGGATKEQVAHMVGVLLGPAAREIIAQSSGGNDATDALAVALAALHRSAHEAP